MGVPFPPGSAARRLDAQQIVGLRAAHSKNIRGGLRLYLSGAGEFRKRMREHQGAIADRLG